MFCQKCGNKLNDGAAFCPKCGTKVIIESNNTFQSTNNNTIVTNTKSKKKNFIIIGIVLFLFVFIIRVFGCSKSSNIDRSLVGYWWNAGIIGNETVTNQLEIYKSGSDLVGESYYIYDDADGNQIDNTKDYSFKGNVIVSKTNANEGEITIIDPNTQNTMKFSYYMDNGKMTLTLIDHFDDYGRLFLNRQYEHSAGK
jgi:hypothetical protein